MTLWQVLSNGERVIVLSNEEDRSITTWNQSATLQRWVQKVSREDYYLPYWEETDCRTLSNTPKNYAAAVQAALTWAVQAALTWEWETQNQDR